MNPRLTKAQSLVAALVLTLGLTFEVAVVWVGTSVSPDARQYYHLGQELVLRGRLALGPPPAPPSYVRLPGYPLVAGVLIDAGGADWTKHARRATLWNVGFDLATALLLLWMGRRLWGAWVGIVAAGLYLLTPLVFLLAAYPLTESLATLLSTAMVALMLWPDAERPRLRSVLTGLCLGFGALVRFDLLTLVPALLLGVWLGGWTRRQMLLASLCALVVYLPWPVRNQLEFGAPHFAGVELPNQQGVPIPSGFTRWLRTWSAGRAGEAQLANLIVFDHPFDRHTRFAVMPSMYDSPEEEERVSSIVDRLGTYGFSDRIDQELNQLADERTRRRPFRTLISLPLLRLGRLYAPAHRGEMSARVDWLGLPDNWWMFTVANWLLYPGALAGAIVLWLQKRKKALAIMVLVVVGRTGLHAFAVPHFVGQRYLVEVVPLFVLGTAVALVALVRLVQRRRLSP